MLVANALLDVVLNISGVIVKTNLPYLFVYKKEEYRHLNIPNTTNACDGYSGHLKRKVEIHRCISFKKKQFLIEENLRN
ncbi:hypothetical protein FACS1894152_0180 [Bacilli bacterium]|nr:hypothetical protein FACS1894152_0180 [Bacilli bacterium]